MCRVVSLSSSLKCKPSSQRSHLTPQLPHLHRGHAGVGVALRGEVLQGPIVTVQLPPRPRPPWAPRPACTRPASWLQVTELWRDVSLLAIRHCTGPQLHWPIFLFCWALFCLCFSSMSLLCWSSLCCRMLAEGRLSILQIYMSLIRSLKAIHQAETWTHDTLYRKTSIQKSVFYLVFSVNLADPLSLGTKPWVSILWNI